MGKKEKDKSKKYDEIRAIVREEIEAVLRSLSINVQLDSNAQPVAERPSAEETTEGNSSQAEQTNTETGEPTETAQDKAK